MCHVGVDVVNKRATNIGNVRDPTNNYEKKRLGKAIWLDLQHDKPV